MTGHEYVVTMRAKHPARLACSKHVSQRQQQKRNHLETGIHVCVCVCVCTCLCANFGN